MTALAFRPATQSDLPTILMLCAGGAIGPADDPANAGDPCYLDAFNAITSDPNHEMIIAELAGKPVGCLQISYLPGLTRRGMWRGILENVHISADQRGQGLGSQMILWAVEKCRARGCGMVQLTSNKQRTDAHRFYRTLGFDQSHEGFKLML